ncbi:hypothetical protein ACFLRC_04590, partial [Candidatus Altiarchaeota archaeon]
MKHSRKRGQLFTWDLIFASTLFMLNLFLVIYFWETSVREINSARTIQDMGWAVESVSDKLIRTSGLPVDWDDSFPPQLDDVVVFGLAEDEFLYGTHNALDRVLDPDKFVWLANFSYYKPNGTYKYDEVRRSLLGGGEYDFFIDFHCLNQSSVDCFGGLFFDSFAGAGNNHSGNISCSNGFRFQIFNQKTYQYQWFEAEELFEPYLTVAPPWENKLAQFTTEHCGILNCPVSNGSAIYFTPATLAYFQQVALSEPWNMPKVNFTVALPGQHRIWIRHFDDKLFLPNLPPTLLPSDDYPHNYSIAIYEFEGATIVYPTIIKLDFGENSSEGSYEWYELYNGYLDQGTYHIVVGTPHNIIECGADMPASCDFPLFDALLVTDNTAYDPTVHNLPLGNPIKNVSCVMGRYVEVDDPFLTDVVTDKKMAFFSGQGLNSRILTDHELEMELVLYKGEAPVIPPSTTTTIDTSPPDPVWIDCTCPLGLRPYGCDTQPPQGATSIEGMQYIRNTCGPDEVTLRLAS